MQKTESYQDLLRTKITKSIEGLHLIAKIIVANYQSGQHVSNGLGSGIQFNQYRNYEMGDDLRMLDWKLYARSNKFYIKQAEIESNTQIKFIIDASKSMQYAEDNLSKLDYAKIITAALSNVCQQQNDAFGLYAINDAHIVNLFPKHHKQQYQQLLGALVNLQSQGKWPKTAIAQANLQSGNHKELIVVLTDFYEMNNELSYSITQLKTPKNEVIVFHLMHKNEMEFNYKTNTTFEDLETGERVKVDPKTYKNLYLEKLQKQIKVQESTLLSRGISYELFRLDEPLEKSLHQFFKKRNALK